MSAEKVAEMLVDARESGNLLDDIDAAIAPTTVEVAYDVHAAMAGRLGKIGGWKVGASAPDATPAFAPMPLRWFHLQGLEGNVVSVTQHRYRGVEAEIAFLMRDGLPPREEKYSREEIIAAIESCHPAIEVLESAFAAPEKVAKMTTMSDLQSNGGFIPGPTVADWERIDFTREAIEVTVNGMVEVSRVASNSAGTDLLRLVEWLVNVGTVRYGGVKAGDWITTGSWTGKTICPENAEISIKFSTAGSVEMRFN
jgi:2-keto-4-pentenoate hydratase